ncbi:Restriction modification system DNA specificity domain protein [Candidatus Accumulibacter aalborgensis]|uniref:Restriction modification system DNA specificity domain protein n=1 Tax=Candidatus Accumulibacter aalborgensis TaxID=1860102 RepID=A0A1A8XVV4_9PROT|nr:restriction endonuclease subunit S [Candidatus Accumulibacter aalborgensis]SBT08732.1 Restriction modification system DNA specificity domain protein [Candidatus Accumulibacter aalborgensis]
MNQRTMADLYYLAKGHKAADVSNIPIAGYDRYIQIDDLRTNSNIKFAYDPRGTRVLPNDICIAWDGANAGTVAYSLSGLIGSTIARLRPREEKAIHTPFVGRFLQEKFNFLNEGSTGATIPHISKDRLMGLIVPFPEVSEQRRIAAILDKADAIRRKRRESIRLADDLVRGAVLILLGEAPDHRISIDNLLADQPNSIRTGPFGSQLLHSEFTESGIPVLGIDNAVTNRFRWAERRYVSEEKYKELSRYTVLPGDVIITIMGTTGRVCVAPDDLARCISTKHLCTMTTNRDKILPEYLWASLLWDSAVRAQAAREGKGAIMEGWNMGIVRSLLIKVPTMSEQRRFVAFLKTVDVLREKLVCDAQNSDGLFTSLSHQAFADQP